MTALICCNECGGEGRILTSRGGTDPDVRDLGPCEECDGSGNQPCSVCKCDEAASGLNSDGEPMCADCLKQWQLDIAEAMA